jgi:thioester reductase-like protein
MLFILRLGFVLGGKQSGKMNKGVWQVRAALGLVATRDFPGGEVIGSE